MTKSKQQKTTLLPTPIGKQVLAHLAQEGIKEGPELRRWIELGFAAEKAGFRLEGTQVCSPLGRITGPLQAVDAVAPAQPASGAVAGVVAPVSEPRTGDGAAGGVLPRDVDGGDVGEISVQPAAQATEQVSTSDPVVVSQAAGGDQGTQAAPAAFDGAGAAGAAPEPASAAGNATPSVQTGDEATAGAGDVGGDRGAGAAPASDAAAPVPAPVPEQAAETPLAAAVPVLAPVAETPIDSDLLGALRGL